MVTIDQSGASTAVLTTLNVGKADEVNIAIRQSKYLNNLFEQDHRNIKRRTNRCRDRNRSGGYGEEDIARLFQLMHGHINMLGHYTFTLPDDMLKEEMRVLNFNLNKALSP